MTSEKWNGTAYIFPSNGGAAKWVALDFVDKQSQTRERAREGFLFLFLSVSFLTQQKQQPRNDGE